VIDASNNPDGKTVNVSYVQGDKTFRVSAKKCVLACNNAMIPYLCPELPQAQKQALSNQVKSPILFTRVAIKNWRAWKEMGLNRVVTSGGYHSVITLQRALSLGDYICPQGPDEPIVVCMYKFPHVNNKGLSAQEQFRMGRHELLTTPFEEMERHIRSQLNELLGPYGFDAAEDIEAIIVNRWAHGYAYERGFHSLFDQDYDDRDDERYLHVQGRKPCGNITIANSDAGASAMLESAIDQAHRAVSELHTG
jgi:spermidine dehydrogenase